MKCEGDLPRYLAQASRLKCKKSSNASSCYLECKMDIKYRTL